MTKVSLLLLFIVNILFVCAQGKVTAEQNGNYVFLKNDKVQLGFNLQTGVYFLKNENDDTVIDNAYFQAGGLESKDDCEKRTWSSNNISDKLGKGIALNITISFKNYADILWQVCLYEDKPFFIFNMGINNDVATAYQLMSFSPLISNEVYKEKDNTINYRVLDGNGGGSATWVTDTNTLNTFNNALVKFGRSNQTNILVAGGVTYHEFEKFIKIVRSKNTIRLLLHSEDPVGRRIDAGSKYWLNEKYYLCFTNQNPFEALEQYATVLKTEQDIHLNYYNFPTEGLWYANVYNHDKNRRKFNDSKGAVEEMDNAIKSGITKYTKVAIRLVPDAYGPNNQQGWWDDEHWAKWGDKGSADGPNYIAPYLTTKSWAQAIIHKGGYPFTYIQSGRRSEDFVKLHPDWMLFNDPYKVVVAPERFYQELTYPSQNAKEYSNTWWTDKHLWSYDFTDTGFIKHMQTVYVNLKHAGIKGIFYDYPVATAWDFEGGFDNKYATTAWAYRNMFQLAVDGLGKDALLQERNIVRGSDITLGLTSSQRVWADNSSFLPEMVSRCGLRWYKNRVVINYDMDAKDPENCYPKANNDGSRCMLTMCYVTSGRFLLARSFSQLSKEQLHDLSRIFPYPSTPQSARPIDAFNEGVKYPRIYDFEVNPSWHQLTFYNYATDTASNTDDTISVWLSKSLNEGGLQLDSRKDYYVFDFWNNHFIGLINGSIKFEQQLRPGEARMMSIHEKENHPQFISSNRHIMQGYIDLKKCNWNESKKTLEGVSDVVNGDAYKLVVATNGYKVSTCNASGAECSVTSIDEKQGIVELNILTKKNELVAWKIKFK